MHLHTPGPTIRATAQQLLDVCDSIDRALNSAHVDPLGVSIIRTSAGHTLTISMRNVPDLDGAALALGANEAEAWAGTRLTLHYRNGQWQGIPLSLTASVRVEVSA